MKFKVTVIALALIAGFQLPIASANVKPVVESFTFTPDDLDLSGKSTRVDFELVVSHPSGIDTTKVEVTIKNSKNDSVLVDLYRTDSPRETGKIKVTFKGGLDFPRDLIAGVYSITASEVRNNSSAGYQYSTGTIEAPKVRALIGAESALLVRNFGELDFGYETFVGPTYDSNQNTSFSDTSKYNSGKQPIWKVGETFNPSDFFEVRVPSLSLFVTSTTESVCSSDGKNLKLLSIGDCNYRVSTRKTSDYREKSYSSGARITEARVKIELQIEKVSNQTSVGLPKTIELPQVYSVASGYILPRSETPQVCISTGFFVKLISGGTCTLSYQSPETSTYKASDVYRQTFEISRTSQTLDFVAVNSVALSAETLTLSATASSGSPVSFSAEPTSNCTISGNSLTLLKPGPCNVTAQQVGTTTIAPVSKTVTITITGKAAPIKRTISCFKGSKTVKVTKVNPKCPKGYSRVR